MIRSFGRPNLRFSSYSKLKEDEGIFPSDRGNSEDLTEDVFAGKIPKTSPVSLPKLEHLKSRKSFGGLHGLLKNGKEKKSPVSIKSSGYFQLSLENSSEASIVNTYSPVSGNNLEVDSPATDETHLKRQSTWRGKRTTVNRALRRSPGHGDLKNIHDEADKLEHLPEVHPADISSDELSNSTSSPRVQDPPSISGNNLNLLRASTPRTPTIESPVPRPVPSRWLSKRSSKRDVTGIQHHDNLLEQRVIGKGMLRKIRDILGHDIDGLDQTLSRADSFDRGAETNSKNPHTTRTSASTETSLPANPFDNDTILMANTRRYEVMSFGKMGTLPETMPIYENMKSARSNGIFDEDSTSPSHIQEDTSSFKVPNSESNAQVSSKVHNVEKSDQEPGISRYVRWSSVKDSDSDHRKEFLPQIDFQDSGFFESSMLETSTPRVRLEPLWNARGEKQLARVPLDSGLEAEVGQVSPSSGGRSPDKRRLLEASERPASLGMTLMPAEQKGKTRPSRSPPKDSLQLRPRTTAKERLVLGSRDVNATRKSKTLSLDAFRLSESKTDSNEASQVSGVAHQESAKNIVPSRSHSIIAPPRFSSRQVLTRSPMMDVGNHWGKRTSTHGRPMGLEEEASSMYPLQLDLTPFRIGKM
jgi:hypothetical protein